MYQRLAYYQDFFPLNLSKNYRLSNIVLFVKFFNIHICFVHLIPLTAIFLFYGIFVHIPKVFILSGFLLPSVVHGALYVSYRRSKYMSNKLLFGPDLPESNCFAGTYFILFHDFLEDKRCI